MLVLTILFGVAGLGIIVFVHELGHFIAAKSCGISVETFSLGWGNKLIGFKWGETTYQISWFLIGGYCKMKGEMLKGDLNEEEVERMRGEKGSFLAASPWKRALVYFCGPLANIVFSILVLTLIWWLGFNVHSSSNKIVLATDYSLDPFAYDLPANRAKLKTGDLVVAINDRAIRNFWELSEAVKLNVGKRLKFHVERYNNTTKTTHLLELEVTPEADPETGLGRIGVYAWVDPVIDKVEQSKAAAVCGLLPGDRILEVDNKIINHEVDFMQALWRKPEKVELIFKRDKEIRAGALYLELDENQNIDIGLSFKHAVYDSPDLNLIQAFGKGFEKTYEILNLTAKGIGLITKLRIRKLNDVVAGPIRITQMMGEAAIGGFGVGIGEGFVSFFQFICLLSVIIAIMNLLPIPALDGGAIILNIFEAIRNKPLKLKFIYRFQIIGFVLIFLLLITAVLSDILFFVG